ncbi:hypothetical protein ABL78_3365 [Leptomonas seymouri]|uniref:CSD domain-containing protein n=1 Tax=Leptomonas seymouri TaxID=5684 RepID=A0A0N1IL24_LEPSE|nr:hypothetical protein ABL78_3365 [Leptomonas seymouri]|eukprot:KPI87568.1 hypothetical protein ABL78_3365 [Leptomonas seymouri]
MPPKLTSKNIFDVVFEQLPADAFIDTGPASLREELMLEAAGISGNAGGSGERSNGRGGSSQFRRHLLPSSSTAAAGARSLRPSDASDGSTVVTMATTTTAASATGAEDDVLGEGDAVHADDDASAPPAYAPSASHTAAPAGFAVEGQSLFRRVDDGDGADVLVKGAKASDRRGASAHGAEGQGGSGVAEGTDADTHFSMQMDEDDDAVKEATRYAKLLAAMQAEAENSESGTSHVGDADRRERLQDGKNTAATASALEPGALAGPEGAAGAAVLPGMAGPQGVPAVGAATSTPDAKQSSSATHALMIKAESSSAQPPMPFNSATAVSRSLPLTAAEQLALMPPGLDRVYTGVCVMYRHPKGFGFISPDLGGPDVYFINDGVALLFTRLALRAFYLKLKLPLPSSVAAAYRGASASTPEEPGGGSGTAEGANAPALTSSKSAPTAEANEEDAKESHPTDASASEATTTASTAAKTNAPAVEASTTEGVLGDSSAVASSRRTAEDVSDRVAIPPTTAEELAQAEAAAALLTPATAQLLQHQVDQGFGGGVRVGEKMSFVVTRNHAGRGGSGRLLRAEFIRGVPRAHFAMPVEQSWFAPMFPGVVGRKAGHHGADTTAGGATADATNASLGGGGGRAPDDAGASSAQTSNGGSSADKAESASATPAPAAALVRYTGCVRTYDPEDQRGYLRCDEVDSSGGSPPDVVFHAHAVLWDVARCPPLKRQIRESMRVAYSVCGTERNGKYIATLITTPEGVPFSETNMTFAENVRPYYMSDNNRRRGRGDGNGGGLGSGRAMHSAEGGMGGGGDAVGGDRKRAKAADEDLLLFEDDDYPFM